MATTVTFVCNHISQKRPLLFCDLDVHVPFITFGVNSVLQLAYLFNFIRVFVVFGTNFEYVFSAVLNCMYKFLCNVQEVIAQTRDKEAASMTEVSWRGRTVPVKNEKVRSFILHAQQSARELDRAETLDSKLTLYDDLLMECKDALQAVKDELKGDTVSSDCLLLKFLIPKTWVLDWYRCKAGRI